MKTGLGVLVGALVYFTWGFVSWMVLPWHHATVRPLPQELLLTDTMKVVVKKPGFYAFPSQRTADGAPQPPEVFEKRRNEGPLGVVVVRPEGTSATMRPQLVRGFLAALLVSAFMMYVLCAGRASARSVAARALLSAVAGLAAGAASHLVYWNWFYFPADVTLVGIADLAIGFALLGAALAKFVPEDGRMTST